jgi:NAD(P)-dependent dehydrogenase (short-subunit alcohol dehydrogenase family)
MPTVLVTGAGRGIGRSSAVRLARAGWDVLGGIRNLDDGKALVAEFPDRITPIQLDITSESDIAALDEHLPETLNGVVNNAGIALGGPVEGLPLAEWRRQFEVNLFGQIAVTQAVLPWLRPVQGRVVFVSSISGRVSTPMTGAYNASKFALEATADALRMELRPWRIRVSLVEPAQTDTSMWQDADVALEHSVAVLTPEHRELYRKHIEGARKAIPRIRKLAADPDGVARAIERALTARRPKARYAVGANAKIQAMLAAISTTPMFDATVSRGTGIPRKP